MEKQVKMFRCDECGKEFRSQGIGPHQRVAKHTGKTEVGMATVEVISKTKLPQCPTCGIMLKSVASVGSHMRNVHQQYGGMSGRPMYAVADLPVVAESKHGTDFHIRLEDDGVWVRMDLDELMLLLKDGLDAT